MEGLVGLDPQEQLIAILQTLSKEEIERIPDGAGSLTALPEGLADRRTGFFVAYRKRRADGSVDRVWRFYPDAKVPALSNKTEIVEQIRFPRMHRPLDRFGDESLQKLKEARIILEKDLLELDAKQRTLRMTGQVRKAFEFVLKIGRADLDRFLQTSWQKPAVQRRIRTIGFDDQEAAVKALDDLAATFGAQITEEESPPLAPPLTGQVVAEEANERELTPLPPERDASLELVCWMHVLPTP